MLKYPRFGVYGTRLGSPQAELNAARTGHYCFMTSLRWPEHTRELRKHVDVVAYQIEPQWSTDRTGEPWSLRHEINARAQAGDWYLRTRAGAVAGTTWGEPKWLLDFQRPEVAAAVAECCTRYAQEWAAAGTYNALVFEVLAARLDPDWLGRQNIELDAERWERNTRDFLAIIRSQTQIPIIAGGDASTPDPALLDGIKIEDWRNRGNWYQEFYGVPTTRQRGYAYAHDRCRHRSRFTLVELAWHRDGWSDLLVGLLVATVGLLDGIAMYNPNPEAAGSPPGPYPLPFLGASWGQPVGDEYEIRGKWLVRRFDRCEVRVNIETEAWEISEGEPYRREWFDYFGKLAKGMLPPAALTYLQALLDKIPEATFEELLKGGER